jgi:chorismate mutase
MSESKPEDLIRCRVQIDALDVELLELLNRRTAIVEEIGRIKEKLELRIYEPKREEEVFTNVLSHNQGPLPPAAVKRIFERIIDEMRMVQKINMRTAKGTELRNEETNTC